VIQGGDALNFLDHFNPKEYGRTLIYADPPYLHSTRTSRHRYKHEMTDADHEALLQRLMLCPAHVILSGYPSEMYDSMLKTWHRREIQAMTRGGVRTEVLWFNFEPSSVHYATHAGKDYIDRQRIKRKAARWAQMYAEMPPGERMAVLTAILSLDLAQSPVSLNAIVRPEQIPLSMTPAASSPVTVETGAHSEARLCSRVLPFSPLPDSGATKPGHARSAECVHAEAACR